MGYIYKITNLLNNKCYIGQTKRNPDNRWEEHLRSVNYKQICKRPLIMAIIKHGRENFKFEILGKFEYNILSEKEKEYIKFYNSYGNGGYNATLGGEGGQTKSIEDEIMVMEEYKKIKSIEEVSKTLNICENTVRKILRKNKIEIKRRCGIINHKPIYKTKIKQYSLEGKFIQNFESMVDAIFVLKLNKNAACHIGKCCRNQRKSAYGFKWEYNYNTEK